MRGANAASCILSQGNPRIGWQDRGAEEFNSFFYSLVSTQEMYYSTKREVFDRSGLQLQSTFMLMVITSLPPADAGAELSYYSLDEQMSLLTKRFFFWGGGDWI